MARGFVVAVNQKEADEIARDRPEIVHYTKASANQHLKEVKAPPTDPHYAAQYRVYSVRFDEKKAAEIVTGRGGERQ